MNEQEHARRLAEWLDAPAGTAPPDGVPPEVAAAVYTLRPDRAPAPRVSLDDVLAGVREGPFATAAAPRDEHTGGDVVPLRPQPSPPRRAWWASPFVGVGLAAAAAAAFVVPRIPALRGPEDAVRAREMAVETAPSAPSALPSAVPAISGDVLPKSSADLSAPRVAGGMAEEASASAPASTAAPDGGAREDSKGSVAPPPAGGDGLGSAAGLGGIGGGAVGGLGPGAGSSGLGAAVGYGARGGYGAADGEERLSDAAPAPPPTAVPEERAAPSSAKRAASTPSTAPVVDADQESRPSGGYGSGAGVDGRAAGPWRASAPAPTSASSKRSQRESTRPEADDPVATEALASDAPATRGALPAVASPAQQYTEAARARADGARGRAIRGYDDGWWRADAAAAAGWAAAVAEPDPARAAALFGQLSEDTRAWAAQDAAARRAELLLRLGDASGALRVVDGALGRSTSATPFRARTLLARARALDALGRAAEADAAWREAAAAAGW
jgi:hypothetical protein